MRRKEWCSREIKKGTNIFNLTGIIFSNSGQGKTRRVVILIETLYIEITKPRRGDISNRQKL